MSKHFLIICSLSFLMGCKKDKLTGDKEILVGKWKWIYTESVYTPNCNGSPSTTYYTPLSEGKEFELEFIKKGCVKFFENGNKNKKDRIVFTGEGWQITTTTLFYGYFNFNIFLDNKETDILSGYVKGDTLILMGSFPKESSSQSCLSNFNYFIRE